jgi:hypothetical protein
MAEPITKIESEHNYGNLSQFIVNCGKCKTKWRLLTDYGDKPELKTIWTCPCGKGFVSVTGKVISREKIKEEKGK